MGAAGVELTRVEGLEIPLQGVRKDGGTYSGQYAGARIVVNLSNQDQWTDNPDLVMRHELAHAVTARATALRASGSLALRAPRWAVEGFARWVETVGNPARMEFVRYVMGVMVLSGRFTGKLPSLREFSGENLPFHYELGASVFAYVEA